MPGLADRNSSSLLMISSMSMMTSVWGSEAEEDIVMSKRVNDSKEALFIKIQIQKYDKTLINHQLYVFSMVIFINSTFFFIFYMFLLIADNILLPYYEMAFSREPKLSFQPIPLNFHAQTSIHSLRKSPS